MSSPAAYHAPLAAAVTDEDRRAYITRKAGSTPLHAFVNLPLIGMASFDLDGLLPSKGWADTFRVTLNRPGALEVWCGTALVYLDTAGEGVMEFTPARRKLVNGLAVVRLPLLSAALGAVVTAKALFKPFVRLSRRLGLGLAWSLWPQEMDAKVAAWRQGSVA